MEVNIIYKQIKYYFSIKKKYINNKQYILIVNILLFMNAPINKTHYPKLSSTVFSLKRNKKRQNGNDEEQVLKKQRTN